LKTALVTGGGGFLGQALISALCARGLSVRSIGRGEYPQLRKLGVAHHRLDLSLESEALVKLCEGVDVIFHTAAKVAMWGRPEDFYATNVLGTENLLKAAQVTGVERFVFTSSPSVIANGLDLKGVDEQQPYPAKYLAHYPQTKAQAEKLVLTAGKSGRIKTASLRPHLIFGPGDTNLVPTIVAKAKSGRLRIIGDGNNLSDFTYIADCVEAHLLAAVALGHNTAVSGEAFFISQSDPVPLWNFVNLVLRYHNFEPISSKFNPRLAYALATLSELRAKILNQEPALTRFLVEEMSTSHFFNIDKAKNLLGFRPSCGVFAALEKTLSTERSHAGNC